MIDVEAHAALCRMANAFMWDANVGRWPRAGFFLAWLWCGTHTEVGRYLRSARNGGTDLGVTLNLCERNEAVLSRGGDLVSTILVLY